MSEQAPSKKRKVDYYARDVDFEALGKADPDFAALSASGKKDGFIDFQNPTVVQQLTRSLLKVDFGLTIRLPDDRLCPPVPVRWNYVRWIQDLLDTTDDSFSDHYDEEREVMGLDIGVGASCIYALLACSSRPEWRLAGTDIDAHSLECAKANVKANLLTERIRLKQTKPTGPLIPLDDMGVEELDFVMTNPPFYSSEQDFLKSYKDTGKPTDEAPSAVCVGSTNEMICPDGDVGFVTRIVEESLKLRKRVQWYTAFLSKMSSLQQIVAKLKENQIENFAVTSLHPGHKTKRYAVAWSFGDYRPRNDVARHGDLVLQVLPMATANTIKIPGKNLKTIGAEVNEAIKGYDGVKWVWRPLLDAGVMQCKEDVWSGKARRKRKQQAKLGNLGREADKAAMGDEEEDEEQIGLAVKVSCKDQEIDIRWLRGQDQVLFNSFCAVLRRTLTGLR